MGDGYVTAPATDKGKKYGYVFVNCKLTGADEAKKVYLSRPWRPYGQTVYIQCELGKHIVPEGWNNWGKKENEKTAFYAEYGNRGPGAASKAERVKWAHFLKDKDVEKYTPQNVLQCGNEQDKNGNDVRVEWFFKVF